MIETRPNVNLSNLVKIIKSYTTHHIWERHSKILKKHFWEENGKKRLFGQTDTLSAQ